MKQFFFGSTFTGNKAFNIAWLFFRFYIGFSIAAGAGWPKMHDIGAPGWFIEQVGKIGFTFPSPAFWAVAAAWGEFIGGLCIALGFFTRFSAIQLAFQFFVVSFIWYNEPAPIIGMYYQQLLFWGFVLISVSGAGKYSIDHWIMNRKHSATVFKKSTVTAAIFLFCISSFAQQPPVVTAKDIAPVVGSWQGSLTYLDYTTNKPYTMPANVDIKQLSSSNQFAFSNSFPKEPNANWTDTITISADGRMIDNEKIISKQLLPDSTLQIITETEGVDGNDKKPALFKHTYIIGKTIFSKRKDVLFKGTTEWMNRHEYKYTLRTDSILGTYIIDLRPTPESEPYLKEFKFTKVEGKKFDGAFYGYPFSGGFLNTDWDKVYFAFTTTDQSGTYYHSGYVEGNKVFGITLNEARGFVLPWKGERKKEK